LNYKHLLLNNIKNCNSVTLVTHFNPDLDAASSVYFSKILIEKKQFPKNTYKLARYVNNIDQGNVVIDFNNPINIYTVFMAQAHLIIQKYKKDSNTMILTKAFVLFNHLLSRNQFSTSVDESYFKQHNLWEVKKTILDDFKKYSNDLLKSKKFKINLLKKHSDGFKSVDALYIENPDSIFFKVWARYDKNSPSGNGYCFLIVKLKNNRFIMSVDPTKDVYLKGLGDLLEKEEQLQRKKAGKEFEGKNRQGYDSPNPWYDGRNKFHNFTIIDSPYGGTILSSNTIIEILKNYEQNL
jgi:hypothetical protein